MMTFPQQTDSANPHLRGWGCIFHCYVYMVAKTIEKNVSALDVEKIFNACVQAGVVLDNDRPIAKPGWYRAFCVDALGIISKASDYFDSRVKAQLLYRGPIKASDELDTFSILEWTTKTGSHFTIGKLDGALEVNEYDPGKVFDRMRPIKSMRQWRVTI